jgi:hypothetical protein
MDATDVLGQPRRSEWLIWVFECDASGDFREVTTLENR